MIRAEDDEGDYYSCGIRRVCFEPGLEVIKPEILADNPDLESVTIPASVKDVQTWAFGCCTNLKNLVIEGDLSRVANWAPDAFDACACEEQYLRLRNADR
ncbi:MAG: leucine-rich repeat protein [Clostridia bacterium]|nr:leucine-rich repeat protein [Clostridia bacterium]